MYRGGLLFDDFICFRLKELIAERLQSLFLIFRLNDECHVAVIASIRNHP